MRVLLVGCGKMGQALLTRWQKKEICTHIDVINPSHISFDNITHYKTRAELPNDYTTDIIVFAVKPQTLVGIAGFYKKFVEDGTPVLSIAAGTSVKFLEETFGENAKIIRAMPNTPAAVGKGMTAAFANKSVSDAEKDMAEKLLTAVGKLLWVKDEKTINPVTALAGSGPAYVFLLIEAMTMAGIKIGLDPDIAEILARQTVVGSASLAKRRPDTPAHTLRENVTSPGGTTEAALRVLMDEPAMQDLFDRALKAANDRAEELAAQGA